MGRVHRRFSERSAWRAPRLDPPLQRCILVAVWLLAATAVVVTFIHHLQTLPHGHSWDDSYVFLGSASDFVSHPTQLYDAAHAQLSQPWATRAFLYPPSGLLPFLPLVPIVRFDGIATAAAIWSLVDTAALFAGLIVIGRRLGLGWTALGGACLLIACSTPMRWEITSGQVNGVILLLLVLSTLRLPGRSAGVLMGLAVAVKPVAAIVLLVPLLRRQPAITLTALITFGLLNLLFIPFVGVGRAFFYLGSVLLFLLSFVIHDPTNISLPSVLQTWLGGGALPKGADFGTPQPHGVDSLALLWTTRLAVIVVWLRVSLDRTVDPLRVLCLSLATVPLLTATVWPHYLLFATPLAMVAMRAPQPWARVCGVAALTAMLWYGRADALWISLILLWPVAAVLLFHRVPWTPPRLPWKPASARIRSDA